MSAAQLTPWLLVAILVVLALGWRRLHRKFAKLERSRKDALDAQFRQMEALAALYYRLRPRLPLPATRGWAASPDFLLTVADAILERRPATIVECGSGLTTLIAARCVELNGEGRVYSLEHLPEFAERTRTLLARHGLSSVASVVDAPLADLALPDWQGAWYRRETFRPPAPIDLLIVDGPPHATSKMARYPAVPAFIDALAPGALVLLDDADRSDERAIARLWLEGHKSLTGIDMPDCEKGCAGFVRRKE